MSGVADEKTNPAVSTSIWATVAVEFEKELPPLPFERVTLCKAGSGAPSLI